MVTYLAQSWDLVESITQRHMSRSPRVTFKILAFVCLAAHKWRDICRAKRYKQRTPDCFHPVIFCRCVLKYLKTLTDFDRLFSPDLSLERTANRFLQVSTQTEILLVNTGVRIASVLCSDVTQPPVLLKYLATLTSVTFSLTGCIVTS